MAVKKRGLGRGLDALLSGPTVSALEEQAVQADQRELQHLPLDLIQRGKYQPRRDMDPQALEELANSIKAQGVMQPIVVRPVGDNRYEIIAGERRWRATQQAGLDTVPAMVREVADEAAIAMAQASPISARLASTVLASSAARTSASLMSTPAETRSPSSLRITSSSPASSKSAWTTSFA